MTYPAAIACLVATLALGVLVGALYLNRTRRRVLVWAHLLAAQAGLGLVAALAAAAPGQPAEGPDPAWPLGLLGLAVAAGWLGQRVARRAGRKKGEAVLALHIVAGVAGFFLVLAWGKGL